MRFAAANVRELIFLKIAIEQKAVEYGLKGRIVVASSAFVYTNAYFALQNACWGHPKPFHSAPFRCRLRIPAERFLPGDAFRVVEDLHEVRSGFCQRSILHLFITSDLYEYTFQILQRIDYRSMNRGSTQPLITQGDMSKVSILLPDKKTLLNFESIVGQLMEQYQANLLENDKLSELRDTLLAQTIR